MNDKLISVIVPVYNTKEYLPKCLDSILHQTYSNLEIIVISDGSTDGSNDIIKEYANKDNRIIPILKENTGVSYTRAKGIELAKGDYIGFIDSDDTIESDMYEILIKNMVKYNADISHCGYNLIREHNVVQFYGTGDLLVLNHDEGIKELLSGQRVEPGMCNKLYKAELFDDLDYDRKIRINEDFLVNILLFNKSKKTVFYDITKYNYFVRSNSASHAKVNEYKLYDPIKVTDCVLELFKDSQSLWLPALERYISCNINAYKFSYINKFDGIKNYKKYIKRNINNQRRNLKQLSKKTKYMSYGILYFDFVFKLIYKLFDLTHKGRNKHSV